MTSEHPIDLPATPALELVRKGGVLTVWLNRPRARNALSKEMAGELTSVLDAVREDRSLRALVVRGRGGTFCAGGDIKGFKNSMQSTMSAEQVAQENRAFGDLMLKMNEQPQVTIVLVEGAAIGGGLGLACVADVTLVTQDARFRLSETSLGIPPAQIAPFVVERVGLTAARRLMLTGARFDGNEALALGVAHGVVADTDELNARCAQVLEQIALCAPEATAVTKTILFETLRRPRTDALDFAAAAFARAILGQEGREGIAAFVEKRRPSWADDDA